MGSEIFYTESGVDALVTGLQAADSATDADVAALQTEFNDAIKGQAIGDAVDLNTIVNPGTYHQRYTAQAASGSNYPEDRPGVLYVDSNDYSSDGTMIYQLYVPYGQYGDHVWRRNYYNGTWYPWRVLDFNELDQGGLATLPFDGSSHTAGVSVTFPIAFGSTPTIIQVTASNVAINCSYSSPSATGMTLYGRRTDLSNQGSPVTVSWRAKGTY